MRALLAGTGEAKISSGSSAKTEGLGFRVPRPNGHWITKGRHSLRWWGLRLLGTNAKPDLAHVNVIGAAVTCRQLPRSIDSKKGAGHGPFLQKNEEGKTHAKRSDILRTLCATSDGNSLTGVPPC